ncbi:MAG: OmpH family outer membrane protein [Lentisphaerae bacterium]|nr:OmpH family outer membrane protein [Lentisphaerota bacterium]
MSRIWMAGCLAAFLATAGLAAELRIATVDLDKVFTAHPKTQAAEADLKTAEDAIEAEMEKLMADGRALEEEVVQMREAARNPMLTEEARQRKRAEAEEKLTELQEFQLRARRTQETKLKQLREQVMKSRQGIVDELMKILADFSESEGYDLVFDRSGMTMNMIPLAVYSSPDLDVTDQVIERLNPAAD